MNILIFMFNAMFFVHNDANIAHIIVLPFFNKILDASSGYFGFWILDVTTPDLILYMDKK